jgi:hypothetical protein
MTFWLNARLALAVAPVLLCVLALAGASTRHRRSSAVIVITTLALSQRAICFSRPKTSRC